MLMLTDPVAEFVNETRDAIQGPCPYDRAAQTKVLCRVLNSWRNPHTQVQIAINWKVFKDFEEARRTIDEALLSDVANVSVKVRPDHQIPCAASLGWSTGQLVPCCSCRCRLSCCLKSGLS